MSATLTLMNAVLPVLKNKLERINNEMLTNTGMSNRMFFTLLEEREQLEVDILDMEVSIYTQDKEEFICREINALMVEIKEMEQAVQEQPDNEFYSMRLTRMEDKLLTLLTN